ncbi:MAG: thioredoxin family protein [Desulfobacterales bacterium]|nr:thioredoxin family protein [Desulfobacterales bacterium]
MSDVEVTRIRVGKHPTGIIDLKKGLAAVDAEYAGRSDGEIAEALLNQLGQWNYIDPKVRELYGKAFLREYKKWKGEPFEEEEETGGLQVKVLGPGCPNCEKLEQDLMAISVEMNLPIDLEHVRDPEQIAEYGMMAMPALVIGKEVKAAGRAPTKATLKKWLEQAASAKRNE